MTADIVLVDDQPLVRAGLRVLVADSDDLRVVGEAGTGGDAVALVAELRPDVVVMDIRMPGMDGIEATRMITGSCDARVAVLTTFDDDEYVYAALRAGASGFLVKDMALDDILAGIRVIARGEALLAPRVTSTLIRDFVGAPQRSTARVLDGITARECEVLELVARGLSNAEIAERLFISMATAKAHVGSLLTKLDARDRVQLVILAYEAGLVPR
ncbi:DNA-binding NarL/FixJ family response regulator [Motilibacter peucedani]|uniref:DNA-binding NarL/FixJ family response regulator n=1 Tax=Motilibacter peucedani TaxID=598650 RepID=A0A420XT98_9ACTN|nr:response regulator transcription factor [Motilibacter peucedani]RKS80082.1 DNA-binding NarL/FixJ family response regulator [Motilibacter peucedani]